MSTSPPLTPNLLIHAYRQGIFPMASSRHGPIGWYSPDPRAILPLDQLRISRSLRRRLRKGDYEITFDRAFGRVIRQCARPRPGHPETWINDDIIRAYSQLHQLGIAHSVEAWTPASDEHDTQLVGGLYGVALGGAFFGESMFSAATDASKVCLVHLVHHLQQQHFALLDAQIISPHMASLGAIEISRDEFLRRLTEALARGERW